MGNDKHRPWSLTARYASMGAWAGLLGGMLEAANLARYPHLPFLRVNYAIWFLAPLIDGTVAGLVGLGFGLVIMRPSDRRVGRWLIQTVRRYWVAVSAFAISIVGLVVAKILMDSPSPLHVLIKAGVILIVGLVAYQLGNSFSLKNLGVTLGSIFALMLAGLGVYCIRPSFRAIAAAAGPETGTGKPNIILITLDTVRADHLSVYGYPRLTTPNLDKWAQRGVVFENAIAPSSWTLASHASMFTGLLPHQHGADWANPWDGGRWTLADVLRLRGYVTGGFTSNLWYGEGGWGMDQGFELYDDDSTSVRHSLRALIFGARLLQPFYYRWVRPDYFDRRNAREVNKDVFFWLQNRAQRPFFLFINYYDAHDPYFAPHPYAGLFGDAPPAVIEETRTTFEIGGPTQVSPQDRAALIAAYDNCLAYMDHSVGELLESLSHLPGWGNTVVIITSDHGEGFVEHGTLSHGLSLYREVLHVPLIAFGPHVPKGLRIPQGVATQGLFSTVLELAGAGVPPLYRTSLQRFWTPGFLRDQTDESVVSELVPKFRLAGLSPLISLTTKEWQYIRSARGKEELYYWPADTTEQVNLANSAEYRQVREELHARLLTLVSDSLRPWRRPQYLFALAEPGRAFVPDGPGASVPGFRSALSSVPIGTEQAFFPTKESAASRKPPPDKDLLESLPYD